MIDVREYIDQAGRSPYADWFDRLSAQAAAKVATALTRLAARNFSNVKASVLVCLSTELTSVRDTAFISARMASDWSSCLAAEQRNGSMTSTPL
jgi:hypothetical protein